MKIAVVDSGIGGITTLKCMMSMMSADYYYYMDNANNPYGSKSEAQLIDIGMRILRDIECIHPDLIVIACNTLSGVVGERLRTLTSIPIVLMEPSIAAASKSQGESLVIATPRTIASDKFRDLLVRYKGVKVKASHSLARYIEIGDLNAAKNEVDTILAGEICQNVVLGCTHYIYLKSYIESLGYRVYDGNMGASKHAKKILENSGKTFDRYSRVFIHLTAIFDIERITKYLGQGVVLR